MRLKGKTALITGAGSGLGRAIAEVFAREGAAVAVNDLSVEAAADTVAAVRTAGGRAEGVAADVSDSAGVIRMVAEVVAAFGTVDVLVNNAGILQIPEGVSQRIEATAQEMMSQGHSEIQIQATQSLTDADWARMLAVHLNGTFYCTREVLRIMEAKRSGRIINMASVAGTAGLASVPHYSAAKAGIIGFTKAVARDVVGSGITVNAIAPGFVDTPFLEPLSPSTKIAILALTPQHRLGTAEEIAAAALYLASEEAAFTIGQVLSPNGGVAM